MDFKYDILNNLPQIKREEPCNCIIYTCINANYELKNNDISP